MTAAIDTPETRHDRDCAYVVADGPAPCTCAAGEHQRKPIAGRVVIGPDDPLYKAFRPSKDAVAAIERDEAANTAGLAAIRDMMVGHVVNWPEPKSFCVAIALVDKTLHAAVEARGDLLDALRGLTDALSANDEDGLTEFAEPMVHARAAIAKAEQSA